MNPTNAPSTATVRLTPAVIRVLEWHRRMYSAAQQKCAPEARGELQTRADSPPAR